MALGTPVFLACSTQKPHLSFPSVDQVMYPQPKAFRWLSVNLGSKPHSPC